MTVANLVKDHEHELEIIKKSFNKNHEAGNFYLADKRKTQKELVERFIKDLKKLMQ